MEDCELLAFIEKFIKENLKIEITNFTTGELTIQLLLGDKKIDESKIWVPDELATKDYLYDHYKRDY